jgi:vancomycin resistance protein YoaR
LPACPSASATPHVFAPHYVAPGRDAAVAYPNIDLRFSNPHPWPLRIRAQARGDRLEVRLLGKERPAFAVHIVPHLLSRVAPARLTRLVPIRRATMRAPAAPCAAPAREATAS